MDPVLDALALEAPDVALIGEVVQPVSYCLAAGRELALDEITMVLLAPAGARAVQGLAAGEPAARRGRAGGLDRRRRARRRRRTASGTHAAIGPRLAARRYGAVMLAEDLEDDPGNATRFAWIAQAADAPAPPERGPAKTILVFWGMGSGASGWLVSCLAVFAFAGINLTRIESRPLRQGMGEYMFFLDLGGLDGRSGGRRGGPGPRAPRRDGSSPRVV